MSTWRKTHNIGIGFMVGNPEIILLDNFISTMRLKKELPK
jgi:hypothetical protein